MGSWSLPQAAEIGGKMYSIHTDFRDVLEIIKKIQSSEPWFVKQKVLVALFYADYKQMPAADYPEAIRYLYDFISCGEPDDGKKQPKLIDWEQDYNMISAEINKAAHCEARSLPHLHWFTFVGYFYGIGDGQLSTIVSVRQKRQKGKKLEKWEQEFYREHKARIDFKNKYTTEEQAEMDKLNKMLGG